ncbi:GntR family transcriptional regulator [Mycobacterium heckeshornense]|uniref:FadR/GntR family transcriptional regulator n=1 Tax=Mycobacterium heckeshornense TaxID=110505 RepID=UPI001AF58326|nr:GntR family transcriptional regulator [Mycobacterium heckeshornense]BCQ07294.1 GntR family transcriptional regulator [Mycobacterium heckeshornense]
MSVPLDASAVRVPKAGELVAAELRRKIITGELEVGEPLPSEAALMAQFGVSRPTLREAFRILESEQLIRVLRGARGGARVLKPDPAVAGQYTGVLLQSLGTPLVDVYRARASIEESAVRMSAGRRLNANLKELNRLLAEGAELIENSPAYAEHDVAFHRAVVDLAGSTTLKVLADMLFHIIGAHNRAFIAAHPEGYELPANRTAHRAHAKLIRLLEAGDLEAAQSHWRRHLDGVEQYMIGDSKETIVDVLASGSPG